MAEGHCTIEELATCIYSLRDRLEKKARRFSLGGEAGDLTQDTYLDLFGRLDIDLSRLTGLVLIAFAYNCIDLIKRKGVVYAKANLDDCPSGDSPVDTLILRERAEQVREALENLPPLYRPIIEDFYIEGLSHKEIAKKYGIPFNTVKIRLYRARQLLSSELENYRNNDLVLCEN